MRDIAKIAGVSSATVSCVINGSATVKPETFARVQRVIDELKFIPNGSATTLKYGRSNTYGLIVPDTNHSFQNLFEVSKAFWPRLRQHRNDRFHAVAA